LAQHPGRRVFRGWRCMLGAPPTRRCPAPTPRLWRLEQGLSSPSLDGWSPAPPGSPLTGAALLGRGGEVLMPIGRFAGVGRLRVKHYDDLGLLRPARVDPDSGYRYYRADQAREALSIGLLRSLDVPLPAIGQVLASRGVAEVLG